jgi:hypothetical protein
VTGGQDELHDLAARRGDAKDLASEKPSLRLGSFVGLETQDFFE